MESSADETQEDAETASVEVEDVEDYETPQEKLDMEMHHIKGEDEPPAPSSAEAQLSTAESDAPLFEDPSDEDDGEGEWITPSNVALHKSRALHLLPDEGTKAPKKPTEQIPVGCMTADFAMQNVLLQMGLSLVGVEGKKIERVKTWVLRCHACFK